MARQIDEKLMEAIKVIMNDHGYQNRDMADEIMEAARAPLLVEIEALENELAKYRNMVANILVGQQQIIHKLDDINAQVKTR